MNSLTTRSTGFFLFILLCCNLLAQAQKLEQVSLSLNGRWAFKTDPNAEGERADWFKPGYAESGWDVMNVPSNWDVKNEYAHYAGKAWYRKMVNIPENWNGKTVFLNFEGVYFDSKVWFNGVLLGTNNNGFLPFEYDVSKLIRANTSNTIVVCADNTFRLGAVWNWGGIRRPVKLVAGSPVRILQQHITPVVDLAKGTASVGIKVFLQNSGDQEESVQGEVVLNKDQLYHKEIPFSVLIPANSKKEINVTADLQKAQVHLWHFDDPFLYDCNASLVSGKTILQQDHKRFGIRKIEVDNKNYTFKLNGESVRLMGFNLVPDDRTTGNTLPLWRIKEDVDLMKELGCNMTRVTHLPLTEEMYDYLDEKGTLIFPEVSLWGNSLNVDPEKSLPKEWLTRLIFNNYSHPSIIGWSVGNEIGENPKVMAYVNSAIQMAKHIDSNHLAVMVSHTANNSTDPIQYSDLGLINKYGKNLAPVTEKIHQLHPEKLLFYTEYGVGQLSEDLDGNFDARSMLDSLRNKPYLMGASLWTFNDYRSNFSGTKEFSENRPWGVVDVFRRKKKAWYAIKKEYAPVRELQINNLKDANGRSSLQITVVPRNKFDLPAYTIRNYRLVWSVKNEDGIISQSGFDNLQQLKPGDKAVRKVIEWASNKDVSSLKVELVSGLNYSVCDTTLYFKEPTAPKIRQASGARTHLNSSAGTTGIIRVVFDKVDNATSYKVRYGKTDLAQETPLTINDYIDISGLEPNATYKIAVIAVNSAGESKPTNIVEVPVNYAFVPPVIRYTEAATAGFFVGYGTTADDYMFEVQYTTTAGDYSKAESIQSTNKGVLFVPNLLNGKQYYYRLKVIKDRMFPTLWSEERMIVPDGDQLPVVPKLYSVVRKDREADILFEPQTKATGYVLEFRQVDANDWEREKITAAQIHNFHLLGLKGGKKYEFRLSAENEKGQSAYTAVMRSKE